MKMNEVDTVLRNQGFERGTAFLIKSLAEENNFLKKGMAELAKMFEQMIGVQNGQMQVAQRMKETIENIEKFDRDDLPPSQ